MSTISYIHELRKKIGSERLLVPSVAAIIHDHKNRLLLQRKAGSEGWSLPAGAVELGETPEEALHREVFEETGLKIQSAILTDAFGGRAFRHKYPNGDKVEYTVLVYSCKVDHTSSNPSDPETLELAYFDEAAIPALALPYPRHTLFKRSTVT